MNPPEIPVDDPTLHPKFRPDLGRIERRGRPRKPEAPEVHWRTQQYREAQAPKIEECMNLVRTHFGGMRGFLKAWTENGKESIIKERDMFLKNGCGEILEMWLPEAEGLQESTIQAMVQKISNLEISKFVKPKDAGPLRYVRGGDRRLGDRRLGDLERREGIYASPTSELDDMKVFLKENAPFSWEILRGIAQGRVPKSNADFVTLGCFAGLLNCRNQQINAYQTVISIFLYSSGLSKSAIEVLSRLNMCSSYSHLNEVLKRLAIINGRQLIQDANLTAMKIITDNINNLIGVREGSSIRQAVMNNSTGGYVTPVVGMPEGIRMIPREWRKMGERIKFNPRDLRPTQAARNFFRSWTKFYLVHLLKKHCGSKLAVSEVESSWPRVEMVATQAVPIYALEMMDISQGTISGNRESIRNVLLKDLKYSLQELVDGIVFAGGDQLLADRVRSLQKLMEGDVPGEDFSFVITLLGPLHTLMNEMKLMMRTHVGPADGSLEGSLMSFNKVLKRDRKIDPEAKNLWNCLDLSRDALDAVLLSMMVETSGRKSFESFRVDAIKGDFDWRVCMKNVANVFAYNQVIKWRKQGMYWQPSLVANPNPQKQPMRIL